MPGQCISPEKKGSLDKMRNFTSICIPTYNNPDDVHRLLSSIAEQTFRNYEVIVTDDSDGPLISDVCRSWSLQDTPLSGRIRYCHNEKKLGPVFNWNRALRLSRGDYIKIMFSDDWFAAGDSLGAFVSMLDEHPASSLAFSGSRQVVLNPDSADSLRHLENKIQSSRCRHAEKSFLDELRSDWRFLFFSNQIGSPSAVIYRRDLKNVENSIRTKDIDTVSGHSQPSRDDAGSDLPLPVLFDEKSGFASDVVLYMDILRQNPVFSFTLDPLVCIGLHSQQYTETFKDRDDRVYQDYRLIYDKYELRTDPRCRRHMMDAYIIPYHKPYKEAEACGFTRGQYSLGKARGFMESARSYTQSRLKKKQG